MKPYSDKELNEAIGLALGWITYPSDSVEQGRLFHCEPDKAPFGKTMMVSDFKPSSDWSQLMPLVIKYSKEINRLLQYYEYYDFWTDIDEHTQRALAEYLLEALKELER